MIKNKTTDRVWEFLIRDMKMTPEGAAGYMGNLYAESAIDPTTVEGLLCQRYSEDGDKAYARPVNTGPNRAKNNALYTERIDIRAFTPLVSL